MSNELDTPGGDCTREQLEELIRAINDIRHGNYGPAPKIGIVDISTYPIAEPHLLLCLAALETAQHHAQLAAIYVSRGE